MESFSTKVRIVENKLGVAMEENETERRIENKFGSPKESVLGPTLSEASYIIKEEKPEPLCKRKTILSVSVPF
jgi:hypothetical protein